MQCDSQAKKSSRQEGPEQYGITGTVSAIIITMLKLRALTSTIWTSAAGASFLRSLRSRIALLEPMSERAVTLKTAGHTCLCQA